MGEWWRCFSAVTPPPRLYSLFEEVAGGIGMTVLPLSFRPRLSSGAFSPRVPREGEEVVAAVLVARAGTQLQPLTFNY